MSDRITIDKGVPMPVGSATKYPWLQMEIGDSFFTNVSTSTMGAGHSARAKKDGHKYVTRKEGTGCRVWRVA
jgi:hypothetical protein